MNFNNVKSMICAKSIEVGVCLLIPKSMSYNKLETLLDSRLKGFFIF